ncbi:MAG: PqqD family protein [Bacteroidetes bacterium]|jgi:hypothetical protein|nr:PqqD family protein [Bacteroidota bacterium]MBT6685865.1 PqqD family protein [Bacteroidota bacterium]MBT7144071.1 PqqD family protein [Bacteroidota bacterium]MBT7490993.1 PqqD family protein [Bacteroidota bacterium]
MDSLNIIYKHSNKIISRKEGNEYILVPINRNVGDMTNVFTLKEVAAFIWENIDGKNCLQEILNLLCQEYEIDTATAKLDLENFVKKLEKMLDVV